MNMMEEQPQATVSAIETFLGDGKKREIEGEEGFSGLRLPLDEIYRGGSGLIVDGFHALLVQSTGVFDLAVSRCLEHTARGVGADKLRVVLRVVWTLRFFLGIEVIEISVKFVEAVIGRQELITVAKMVFAELSRGIPQGFKCLSDRYVARLEADGRTRYPDLAHTGAQANLTRYEGGTSRRAEILGIVICKDHAFLRHAINIGGLIASIPME
ncbi:hypothetical protein ASC96_17370 [Rhizobium sp. Root1204]|nr:hypothetical protein ASC96_17370 [Rhizobium sp. Root1204]